MSKRWIAVNATDQTIDIFLQDSTSTTGAGRTGLAFNSAGLKVYYRKGATGASTQLPLVTQTVTGAHADGGFVEIDATNMPGLYRLDLNDTMVNAAGMLTMMISGASNLVVCPVEIEVTAVNPYDGARMGLTSIPNAVPGAANGVLIAGTNAPVVIEGDGNALTLQSTSGNGHGLYTHGNGVGQGAVIEGGTNSGSAGMTILAGFGSNGPGLRCTGDGTSSGLYCYGGSSAGAGATFLGNTGGHGINCQGSGVGHGIRAQSGTGADACGVYFATQAGSGSGYGMYCYAVGAGANSGLKGYTASAGYGAQFHSNTNAGLYCNSSGGNGAGILVNGNGTGSAAELNSGTGAAAVGIRITSQAASGAGHGVYVSSAFTGHGIWTVGGATSGCGLLAQGQGTGHGFRALSGVGASAHGISAESIAASGNGCAINAYANGTGTNYGLRVQNAASGGIGMAILNSVGTALVFTSSGGNGDGISISGNGTGHGIRCLSGAGATGDGVHIESLATSGRGIYTLGNGSNGHGILSSATSGSGLRATSTTGSGIVAVGGEHGLFCDGGEDGIRARGVEDGIYSNSTGSGVGLRAIIGPDCIIAASFDTTAANKLADHMLRRNYANAAASAFGDTVNFRSLLGAGRKLTNKLDRTGSTLSIYAEDDAAVFATQTIATNSGLQPISQLDTN